MAKTATKNAPKAQAGSGRFKNTSARLHIIGGQRIAPGKVSEPFEGAVLDRIRKAPCVVGRKADPARRISAVKPELVELRYGDEDGPDMPEPIVPKLDKAKDEDALAIVEAQTDVNVLIQMAETEERPAIVEAIRKKLEKLQG